MKPYWKQIGFRRENNNGVAVLPQNRSQMGERRKPSDAGRAGTARLVCRHL